MIRPLFAAILLTAPALPAMAQDAPQRIRNVQLRTGEQCPPSTGAEIVVCAPPVVEPYRIPRELRDEPRQDVAASSWAVRADRAMEDTQRAIPNSCSPVGLQGQSGCPQQAAERWSAERRAIARGEPVSPN